MIKFKPGVSLEQLQPQMLIALEAVREEFTRWGLDTVVTSANDGEHMEGSKHYTGAAFDFRTKHSAGLGKGIAGACKMKLGPLGFDVVFEHEGQPNEHLHVEYDPKTYFKGEVI